MIQLALRALTYYWRTNIAVVLGVATAVAVLAGALLVGESVRASLRDLVLQRLGRTDIAVVGSSFFREALAADLAADPAFTESFEAACPLVAVQGLVSDQASGRRASRVLVYGVDDRFWTFHRSAAGRVVGSMLSASGGRDALVSHALANEIGASPGATILVRVQKPSEIPLESMHGQKDNPGETIRLTVRAIVDPDALGDFSLQPRQGDVRAVFLPLERLQQDLGLAGRVNVLLVAASAAHSDDRAAGLGRVIRRQARLEDLGLSLTVIEPQGVLALQSDAGLIDAPRAAAVSAELAKGGTDTQPVLTYLANSMRSASGAVPYSLVTATDLGRIAPGLVLPEAMGTPPIVLNEWAANELRVKAGDPLSLEYYVWEEPGALVTRTTDFRVAAVVPIAGAAADRDLAPVYPGITGALSLEDWDPPFPIDLSRVRPVDEDYWNRYRTTPKAFVPLDVGQSLWRSRYGALTSIRVKPTPGVALSDAREVMDGRLRAALDPLTFGLAVRDVRGDSVAASSGATDFGEYFTYFSFFLVVSALLLAAMFFKLGIEQRARELGLLRAVGFNPSHLRRLFMTEGLVLTLAGGALGLAGAVGYAYLLMTGLRTWWVDAVGTTSLSLHVSPMPLVAGAGGVAVVAIACIWGTLRGLARVSERSLLAGRIVSELSSPNAERAGSRRLRLAAIALLGAAVLLTIAAAAGVVGSAGAFFGAGAATLVAILCVLASRWRRPSRTTIAGRGWWSVARLGVRSVGERPGRSVLSVAVMASACFILLSVDAFRRDGSVTLTDPHSGVGGYSLVVESLLPIAHDPNSAEGRDRLGLSGLDLTIAPFRVLPGDDASCLNLYEPTNPRILAPNAAFIRSGRFAFRRSLGSTAMERANPWLLLEQDPGDGVVPVIADANSMTYVLHREVGDEIILRSGAEPVRLRLVAALDDSIFQSELLMSEANFLRLFPRQQGYGLLLVETPTARTSEIAGVIEDRLADFGADAKGTGERLAEFHRVENTYLSTFQTLGGLGLLLGTVGLAAVILRNVLERRRELALLGAVGYRGAHFLLMLIAENGVLLASGLAAGTLSALLAIAPAAAERGGRLPLNAGAAVLLFSVFTVGVLSSIIAARAVTRAPLLETLRSDQ